MFSFLFFYVGMDFKCLNFFIKLTYTLSYAPTFYEELATQRVNNSFKVYAREKQMRLVYFSNAFFQ